MGLGEDSSTGYGRCRAHIIQVFCYSYLLKVHRCAVLKFGAMIILVEQESQRLTYFICLKIHKILSMAEIHKLLLFPPLNGPHHPVHSLIPSHSIPG